MPNLNDAIAIAARIHDGQTDKSGEPYILHPLRVMLAMDNETDRIAAILHDVAEDSEDGWQEIHDSGFSPTIINAIDALTRRDNEDYLDYVRRAKANPIARRVKMADLTDNLRFSVDDGTEIGDRRRAKYAKAKDMLCTIPALEENQT